MTSHRLDRAGEKCSVPKIPSRGKVLCIFDDVNLGRDIESEITKGGYLLLRARHGMHGYWMAITGDPDVIVADVSDPERESNYLFECLNRNDKTRDIPVVAMVDARHQQRARVSCLRNASLCVTRDIDSQELLDRLGRLVETAPRTKHRIDAPRVRTVDAFFSEFGNQPSRAPRIVTRMLKSQRKALQRIQSTAESID